MLKLNNTQRRNQKETYTGHRMTGKQCYQVHLQLQKLTLKKNSGWRDGSVMNGQANNSKKSKSTTQKAIRMKKMEVSKKKFKNGERTMVVCFNQRGGPLKQMNETFIFKKKK